MVKVIFKCGHKGKTTAEYGLNATTRKKEWYGKYAYCDECLKRMRGRENK